ncbi:MAG: hypothetical protein ABUL60_29710 [Myxococcales bacterium]
MRKALLACWVIAFASGCNDSKISTEDVVELTVCPDTDDSGTACSTAPDADSQSTVVVQVCVGGSVSNSDRRTDLTATLRASHGTWAGHDASDATSLSLPFGSARCQFATLTVDQTPGANRIDASLLGYADSKVIVQKATTLKFVDFTAASSPPLQGEDSSTVQLTVAAHSESGGLPSAGTRVEFTTLNLLPAGSVTMSPLATTLDAEGHANVNVFVPSTIDSFTIVGTVKSPDASVPEVVGSLDIKRQ